MAICRHGVCLLVLLLCYLCVTNATYTPPGPVTNISTHNRTYLCDVAKLYLLGKKNLSTALAGMHISIATQYDTSSVYYTFNNHTGKVTGGLMYTFEQQIATNGGFTFDYYIVPDPNGKSSLPYMLDVLNHFDLLGVYYTDTTARRFAGMGFTQELVDASLVLITVNEPNLSGSLWNFLNPFSHNLWVCVLGIIIVNTILFFLLENYQKFTVRQKLRQSQRWLPPPKSDADDAGLALTIFDGFYQMWGTFVGADGPEPSKVSTHILCMGYFFFMMLLLTTYTANLTSSLIVETAPRVSSIDEANARGDTICVLSGQSAQSVIAATYPNIELVIDTTLTSAANIPTLFANMRSGDCKGAVVGMIDWQTQSVKEASNPDCDLVLVDTFRQFSGALPYLMDYSTYCTSFLDIVLNSIIVGLTAADTLTTLQTNYFSAHWQDISCGAADSSSSSNQLSSADFAGIFVLYCMFCGLAIVRWLYEITFKVFKGGIPGMDNHGDDEKGMHVKYYENIDVVRPKGVLRLQLSAVHGLPPSQINQIIFLKVWTTSTRGKKTLVKRRACVFEDASDTSSCVSALFDDCKCELSVADMESEFFHLDVLSMDDDGGDGSSVPASPVTPRNKMNSSFRFSSATPTPPLELEMGPPTSTTQGIQNVVILGRIKMPCVDILTNKRRGTVKRIDGTVGDTSLPQQMSVNVVLGHSEKVAHDQTRAHHHYHRSKSSQAVLTTLAHEEVPEYAYPLNLMVEFN